MVRHRPLIAWALLAACGEPVDTDPLDSLVTDDSDTGVGVDSDTAAGVETADTAHTDDTDAPIDTDPPPPVGTRSVVPLTGAQFHPAVQTTATAEAVVLYDLPSGALSITVDVAGTEPPNTFVSLEQGYWGEVSSKPAVELYRVPDEARWTLPEAYVLSGDFREAYDAGRMFLKVSTVEEPDGLLRGQLAPPGMIFQVRPLTADQVPGSPEVAGSGEAFVTLDTVERLVTVSVRTEGIQASTAYLVRGAITDDPVGNDRIGITYYPPGENGLLRGSGQLVGRFWDAALDGSLYVVVFTGDHTEQKGRGALRGTLAAP